MDSAALQKLCACVGYATRLSKRCQHKAATELLQQALHSLRLAADTDGKCPPSPENEYQIRKICLSTALGLEGVRSDHVSPKYENKAAATTSQEDCSARAATCAATHTDVEMISKPMCENLMHQLYAKCEAAIVEGNKKSLEQKMLIDDLQEQVDRLQSCCHSLDSSDARPSEIVRDLGEVHEARVWPSRLEYGFSSSSSAVSATARVDDALDIADARAKYTEDRLKFKVERRVARRKRLDAAQSNGCVKMLSCFNSLRVHGIA